MTSLALIPQQPVPLAPLPPDQPIGTFATREAYGIALAQAKQLASSAIVPEAFRGNEGSCFMAIELATRLGASPMMVMQNLHIIKGKPSWSSQFVIGAINGSGLFSLLRFRLKPTGEREIEYTVASGSGQSRSYKQLKKVFPTYSCLAYAKLIEDGELVEGPPVTTEMAIAEGWFGKTDSKWQTMPEVMIMYRAAALFGRFYCPHIMLGMKTVEENEDVYATPAQWLPTQTAGDSTSTTSVDPFRAEFEEVVTNPVWSAKQQDDLRKRYAVADDAGRQQLITNARAHVTPAAKQEVQAPQQPAQPEAQPEPEFQDDRDLVDS